jgi:PncC family amidohydrolase
VPGASAFYRGGIISYATEVKEHVLGVDAATLKQHGAVSFQTALAMASATQRLFSADIGISTTGVAGPTEQDGQPVGTVFLGICSPLGVRHLALIGKASTRNELRQWAATEAILLLVDELAHIPG